ncbi:AAA family ATPase [Desulfitobacterium chlororespirans]|uniref:MinD-like ATPase involved in chromosome partitioning or flagellar assembly n=1 Tax=Desulfitobacterium chlororespirans DSM 11544 TaxID=1121395 RepID=A0A1M7T6G7_9FIRM|nr:AAA family ATPase [Desulfitobacterium chlororespirans]SHN66299.1 MinD-like ATPase involved in chromosome partitioning or flagellar assembly [Desulfitobacterium chlororespirans DSM 11544]
MKIHLVYEQEYVEQLKYILESVGHTVEQWDYSLSQFADYSEKKQTDAEVAIVDGQAGVMEKREIIESLGVVRKNLPNLRLIIIFQKPLEKDENFISKLLTLSIYDMYFRDEYDLDDLQNWLRISKSYADYNVEVNDIKGNLNEAEKPKISGIEPSTESDRVTPTASASLASPPWNGRERKVRTEYRVFAAKIIVISGSKGGIGKTDIAINLAMAFRKHIQSAKICLLDFDFPYGGIARMLNIAPDAHLGDWLTQSKVITEEAVRSKTVQAYGIDFVPMALKIKDGLEFQRRQAEIMLDALRKYYDIIIVDTSNFTESALAAITIASEVIFVCTHDIVSISATHAYKEDLCKLYGVNPDKMSLFLNMVPGHEDISKQHIAEVFEDNPQTGVPIIGYAPYDDLVRQCRNKSAILYEERPEHKFSQGINMIMRSFGLDPATPINPMDKLRNKTGGLLSNLTSVLNTEKRKRRKMR